MPGPNDLTSLANAYAWTSTTAGSDDTTLQRLLSAASTQIQQWLSYNVARATYTRTFDGQGTRRFYVPDLPLVSVASLTIDGFSIPAGSIIGNTQQAGYYNNAHAISLIGYAFTRGFNNIQATYTAGYVATPPDIEQACLDWVKISYANKQMPGIAGNAISVKAGDTEINYGGKGNVTDVNLVPMPSSVYAVLVNYQRVAMVSGF